MKTAAAILAGLYSLWPHKPPHTPPLSEEQIEEIRHVQKTTVVESGRVARALEAMIKDDGDTFERFAERARAARWRHGQ